MTYRTKISRCWWLVPLVVLSGASACDEVREREFGEGIHDDNWLDQTTDGFHGAVLRASGYPFNDCRACHGQQLNGGAVGVSCSEAGACHPQGVGFCAGTCHGDSTSPRPATGAHAVHESWRCETCHRVPAVFESPGHPDETIDLIFGDMAVNDDRAPMWNSDTRRCDNTYCHGDQSPVWEDATNLDCQSCHLLPPIHDRFARIVDESTCQNCHAGAPAVGHLDGTFAVEIEGCNACHGTSSQLGVPPPSLSGSTDPSDPQVGAHRRHLDALAPNRIGAVVPCERCHDIPDEVFAEGHLDDTAPADVDVIQGDYDPTSGTCVVSCHWNRDPGPRWNDVSGDPTQCGACHEFPPAATRSGGPHVSCEPSLDACLECHEFSPSTHVDGEVNYR